MIILNNLILNFLKVYKILNLLSKGLLTPCYYLQKNTPKTFLHFRCIYKIMKLSMAIIIK